MPALLEFVYTFKLIVRFCEKLWTSGAVVEILKLIVLLQFSVICSHVFKFKMGGGGGGALFWNKCSFYKMVLYLCFWNDIFSGTVKQHPVRRICFDAWCVIGAVVQSGWRMLQRLSFFLFVSVSMIVYVMYKKIQTKRRWCRLGQKQLMEQSQRHRCLWSEVKRKW